MCAGPPSELKMRSFQLTQVNTTKHYYICSNDRTETVPCGKQLYTVSVVKQLCCWPDVARAGNTITESCARP